jgi:endoglucanase Acf2
MAEIMIGAGSYNTTLPAGGKAPSNSADSPATPKVTANVTGAVPTNDWWSSLIWQYDPANPYSNNMYPHPLALRARAGGLGFSYQTTPTITNAAPAYVQTYRYTYVEDLVLGVVGLNSPDTKVDDYGDWTVTAVWTDAEKTLKATFGHGLPFVYALKSGGDALITFSGAPTLWFNSNGVVGATVNGHHYGIFGPTGSSWSANGLTLQSNLAGKDYVSVAVLPDNTVAILNDFKAHAYAFVTDTQVTWSYNQANARVTTTFTAATTIKEGTEARPLMALYRHQWLNTSVPLTNYTYISPRGTMKVFRGKSFSTTMAFQGVLPGLPDKGTYDFNTLYNYVHTVATSAPFPLGPGGEADTYWIGKNFGRLAQLVRIADEMSLYPPGCTTMAGDRDALLSAMKTELEDWLAAPDGEAEKMFYYDSTWGTLIGFPANFFSDTQLNDHHFHYGYFLIAAATIAQYDSNWAKDENWGGMVKLLIKDVANWESADTRFPRLRNFDPYAGHSWASGHADFLFGNNQESSSESINFSTGLILWGAATGNTAIRDLGIFMYTNEVAAIEQYWFDVDDAVFPPGFDRKTLGILWGDGGTYNTWWTTNPEELHGINFLPVTGGSLYLGRRPDYVAVNYNELVANNGGPETVWRDIIWEFYAFNDSASATTSFDNNPAYVPEFGESKAHTYHWLHALRAMGKTDTTITANIPTYAVFDLNGVKTYVAYNPTNTNTIVTFSNGFRLEVSARSLVVSDGNLPKLNLPTRMTGLPSLRVLLDWGNMCGATSYRLQIARDRNFTALVFNNNLSASAYLTTLPPATLFFWRVRPNFPNNRTGGWSRVRHFETPNPPSVPTPLAPPYCVMAASNKPTLDWGDSAPGLDHYEVQISTSETFASVLGRGQGGRAYISQYTPEVALAPGTYYWRVRAVNAAGQFSQWSAARCFSVP